MISATDHQDGRSRRLAPIQAIRARLQGRPDSEHEQALIRLCVGLLISLYLLVHGAASNDFVWTTIIPAVACTFMVVAALIFADILIRPQAWAFRRSCGLVLDLSTTTALMILGREGTISLFAVYLWVTLGNGFRYGRRYLAASAILSATGFATVVLVSDFWRQHAEIATSLLIVLLVIPAYAWTLIQKLNESARRAREASDAKSKFLARMSHELRTPLNGVIGMSDLLLDSPIDPKLQDIARSIQASATALLGVIEDVLDFSKIEAGRIDIEKTDFDLHQLAADTVHIFKSLAERKGVRVRMNIDVRVPFMVQADPLHLRQVLTNLLGNAVKFTERGWVELRIKPVTAPSNNNANCLLRFEVEDTGIGIPREHHQRIFESFQQADSSTTRRFGGTGLGIAIARQLVNLMGGKIGLQSELGSGTLFWFELPFLSPIYTSEEAVPSLEEERILVVGQGPVSMALDETLASWSADFKRMPTCAMAAAGLTEDLAQTQPQPVTLVLAVAGELDLDPAQLAAMIREHASPLRTALVLLNADGALDDERIRLDQGYSAVLCSPLSRAGLSNLIHAARSERRTPNNVISLADHYQRLARRADRKLHILIAEDNETNRHLLREILKRVGHEVLEAKDGERALDILEEHRQDIDLMILDMNMPNRGGLEVFQAHRFLARHKPIPTIILTADATPDALAACKQARVDAYLTKPMDARELLGAVARLTERSDEAGPGHSDSPRTAVETKRSTSALRTTNQPLVDESKLKALLELGLDGAFFDELVSGFLRDAERSLSQLSSAAQERDYPEFRGAIHALQGSAGELGAIGIVTLCNELKQLKPFELGSPPTRRLIDDVRQVVSRSGVVLTEFAREQRKVIT